jgi:hypothetical protein
MTTKADARQARVARLEALLRKVEARRLQLRAGSVA